MAYIAIINTLLLFVLIATDQWTSVNTVYIGTTNLIDGATNIQVETSSFESGKVLRINLLLVLENDFEFQHHLDNSFFFETLFFQSLSIDSIHKKDTGSFSSYPLLGSCDAKTSPDTLLHGVARYQPMRDVNVSKFYGTGQELTENLSDLVSVVKKVRHLLTSVYDDAKTYSELNSFLTESTSLVRSAEGIIGHLFQRTASVTKLAEMHWLICEASGSSFEFGQRVNFELEELASFSAKDDLTDEQRGVVSEMLRDVVGQQKTQNARMDLLFWEKGKFDIENESKDSLEEQISEVDRDASYVKEFMDDMNQRIDSVKSHWNFSDGD